MSQQEQELLVPAGFVVYTIMDKRQIFGKNPTRFWQDFRGVSTKRGCRRISAATPKYQVALFFSLLLGGTNL